MLSKTMSFVTIRLIIWVTSFISIMCDVIYFVTFNHRLPKWDHQFKAWAITAAYGGGKR